jgi:hypothetical protein
MEILILWLVCAVVGALIAQSKNRSPVVGALWGGLLGVIGVVIIACHSKLEK